MRPGMQVVAVGLVAGALGFVAGAATAPRWAGGAEKEPQPAPEATPAPLPAPRGEREPAAGAPGGAERMEAGGVIPAGPLPEPYATRLDSLGIDVDGDGTDETVELFAAVERDDRGRLMWDDGQRWMLRVREGGAGGDASGGAGATGWLLFDDRVQLGRLTFAAVTRPEGPPLLVLELATGAALRVWSVRHDAARGGFVQQAEVAAAGNVVHRTPAAALE